MIRVNLLPQRKTKRAVGGPDQASKQMAIGAIAVVAAAALVFVAFDMPKRSRLSAMREANKQLQGEIAQKNKQLVGFEEMKKAEEESVKRAEAINRLLATKVVPAHVLHELGRILTREGPTMTEAMTTLTGIGPASDPNKRYSADWDPGHVWISSFVDTNGSFKLDGGAQSESDVTQLSKRLAASVYFLDVQPIGGERFSEPQTGVNYYRFTITGKVAY